jgi:DNA-binding MurR/RpiR family transcriptional regulator
MQSTLPETGLLLEIRRRLGNLPERQARLAQFILKNPEQAKDISLQDLCKRCDTSEPVVFAFCKALGIEGFKSLKTVLAGDLGERRARARPESDLAPIDEELTSDSNPGGIFRAVARRYSHTVEETLSSIDPEQFALAVERIATAQRLVLIGVGISGNVGFVVQQNFLRTGIPVTWTIDPNQFFTHLAPLKKGDVCVALSQTGSQKDMLDGIRFAAKRKICVISITSDSQSPIATEANILLLTGPAPIDAATHLSIGGQIALPVLLVADALAVAVGARSSEAFKERARATAEAMKPRLLGK